MKPELVDAAFRRRTVFKRGKNNFEAPTMIDNFQPLERHDISDLLQDFTGVSSQPLMASQSENFDAENIYFLESEADMFNLNYSMAPTSVETYSVPSVETYSSLSPSHSISSSLSPSSSSSVASSYSDYGDMSADGASYTININLSDIENQIFSLPEAVYQTQTDKQPEARDNHLLDEVDEAESCDESEFVQNNFDIEALVDECFLNHRKDDREIIIHS